MIAFSLMPMTAPTGWGFVLSGIPTGAAHDPLVVLPVRNKGGDDGDRALVGDGARVFAGEERPPPPQAGVTCLTVDVPPQIG